MHSLIRRVNTLGLLVFSFLCAVRAVAAEAGPAPAPTVAVSGIALLREWVQPAYPEAMRKAKKQAVVTVELVVDAAGNVTEAQVQDSAGPEFDAAALDAVRRWKFKPALDEGTPVASGMTVPVEFSLAQLKQKKPPALPPDKFWPVQAKRTPSRVVSAPDPEYPEELEERKLPGLVELEIEVDATGRVSERHVRMASHGAFVTEALRVVETWKFDPAHQGLLACSDRKISPVTFSILGARRPDILAANGLRVAEGVVIDVLPEPVVMTEPVYPWERLVAGETGVAEAAFTITPRGFVEDFELRESSQPEFGATLTAAVETWYFRPGMKDGNNKATRVILRHEFRLPESGPLARLVTLARGEPIPSARGLDGPLQPLWRGFPAFPRALQETQPKGEATVEFVIDRDGRARLPRVVSASAPEFGWAAVTAVAQWVFLPPKRGGERVDVRVSVPLQFAFTP